MRRAVVNPLLRKVGNAGSRYVVNGRNIFWPLDQAIATLVGLPASAVADANAHGVTDINGIQIMAIA